MRTNNNKLSIHKTQTKHIKMDRFKGFQSFLQIQQI